MGKFKIDDEVRSLIDNKKYKVIATKTIPLKWKPDDLYPESDNDYLLIIAENRTPEFKPFEHVKESDIEAWE